ncbi:hypothetical protein [Nakamurella sp.]
MMKSHRSVSQRLADRRSRRLINKAIAEAPSQTMRNELLVVAQRQLGSLR